MRLRDIPGGIGGYVRSGVRGLHRNGSKSFAAIAVLAMGIGMSVAMFSVVDAVVLRPLPFPNQKSIEVISKVDPVAGRYVEEMAYPELRDLEQGVPDFQFVAMLPTSLYGYARVLRTDAGPVQIEGTPVSHNFFRVLGVKPLLGRDFTFADEHVGAAPVVMVSYSVWREYFGGDPHLPGRAIQLNSQDYTVAGVLGPGVEFPRGAGFWYPLGVEKNMVERRTATFLQAIARVRPGVPRERVVTEAQTLIRRLALEYPEAYSRSQQAVVTPLIEYWTGSSRIHLWILLGASILLFFASILSSSLLIVSSILGRETELATRIALGASRMHILMQLAAEGTFLASAACGAGLALAAILIRLLIYWAPADIPRLTEASLNPASMAFAMLAAFIAGLACSILPAFPAMRLRVESVLREGSTRLSLSRHSARTRNVFILCQTSITVVALMLAGLFLVSYRALIEAGTGFSHRDALTVNLQVRGPGLFAASRVDPNWRLSFYRDLLNRLRESPGVTSAAAVLVRPLEGSIGWDRGYEFEFDRGRREDTLPEANYEAITPQYFQTVGTPLLEGRDFNEHDSGDAARAVIISHNLARRMERSGRFVLGQRIRLAGSPDLLTIVGVCADARYRNVAEDDVSIFVPYGQSGAPTPYVLIRGTRSREELGALIRRVLGSMDATQAVAKDATIGELIDANMARHRFNMNLLLWFAVFVTVLATTGIYAVIAESTAARKQEIAIRLALGAPRVRLVSGLVQRTLAFAMVGEAIGLCGMIPISHWISGLLYGVSPLNLRLEAFVVMFIGAACLVASCLPAWAITRGPDGLRFRRYR